MKGKGFLPFESLAKGKAASPCSITANGRVTVGSSQDSERKEKPVIWDATGKIHPLTLLPGTIQGNADRVSPNGRVIRGQISDGVLTKTVVWKLNDVFECKEPPQILSYNEEQLGQFLITEISEEGRVIVGTIEDANNLETAFKWTRDEGVKLFNFDPEYPNSRAHFITADGTKIIGEVMNEEQDRKPVIWDRETQRLTFFKSLKRRNLIHLERMSADATVVVGLCNTSTFIWTPYTGKMPLQDFINFSNKAANHFSLIPSVVNFDGAIVSGTFGSYLRADDRPGFNPKSAFWQAYIPHIPTFIKEGLPLNFLKKRHQDNINAGFNDLMDVDQSEESEVSEDEGSLMSNDEE